jgi:serine protease Do
MKMAVAAVAVSALGVASSYVGSARAQAGASVCGWIGVAVSPMTPAFADSLGMTEIYGAIFERPEPGSPAAHVHIESGDVLTAINGSQLRRAADFAPLIAQMAPSAEVHLTTWRDGQLIERKLILGSAPCPR